MSAAAEVQAALVAALRAEAALAEVAVFDCPPVRAAMPFAVVEEPVATEWGTKDVAGREARLAVLVRDAGERPVRLRMLIEAVETAGDAVPRSLAGGWRVVTLRAVRSRIAREGEGRWLGMVEFQARMLRLN